LALWVVIVGANYLLLWVWLPPVARTFAELEVDLPLPLRVYAAFARLAAIAGVGLLLLAAVVGAVLRWRKVRVTNFLKSGKLLAVVTYAAVAITMLGLLSGLFVSWSTVGKIAP
jgi:hypothetical protein